MHLSEIGTVNSSNCNAHFAKAMSDKSTEDFSPRGFTVNFKSQHEDFVALSVREVEVLKCIAGGLSSKQCAQELGIAPRTIERHVENLRNKLNARNKPHLVAKALSAGLI
jgi:DNA-binding CsgD family transcriptional regulator